MSIGQKYREQSRRFRAWEFYIAQRNKSFGTSLEQVG
jgi:hypothetical protein